MPLNSRNTRNFAGVLRGGSDLQKIILYKRGFDQEQGQVVALVMFRCWRGPIQRAGQPLRGRLTAEATCVWSIPRAELNRAGVDTIMPADKLYDPKQGDYWSPFASTTITEALFGNVVRFQCRQTDPLGPFG